MDRDGWAGNDLFVGIFRLSVNSITYLNLLRTLYDSVVYITH